MKPVHILRIIAVVALASAVPLVTEATPLSGTSLTPAARTTTAADGWTSRGLEGRTIGSLVVDPSNPSRIYAAAGVEGVYRTSDGGENWSRVDIGRFVERLAIDAQAPDTLYAVAGFVSSRFLRPVIEQQLFKSLDRGKTWTQADLQGPVRSVAVDPRKPGLLYAGRDNATVSTSRDGGSTWSASDFRYYCSDFCDEAITALALDLSSPSTIYAGIDADFDYPGFNELFKSTDGGSTWKACDAGLVLWSSVYAIAVDPGDPKRVLAGTSAGTYLSRDSGSSWSATSGSPSRAFAFDPRDPSVVYAGTDREGVLRSTDRGEHWSPMNVGLPSLRVLSLAIDGTGGLLLAATRGGVFAYSVAEPRDLFIDVFDAVDGATGFLMIGAGRTFRLGTVDGSGRQSLGSAHGPYPDWTPGAADSSPDGGTRVLWNSDAGSAALWLTRPEGVQASFLYPARPGWAARDLAAGADGSTHLLWAADDGAISLWTVDRSGVPTRTFDHGPYSGWSPVAIANGTDGRTRLLWTKIDGTAGLSFFDSTGMLDSHRYEPGDGWKAVDLAVDNGNQTRILRAHEDGAIALWTIDADGQPVSYGTLYPPPPGFQAARVSTGSDGMTRLLWRDPNGLAIVWLLSADGLYQSSFPLN